MTTVRAQCPVCGDVKLQIHDLTVRICTDEVTPAAYRFQCPICDQTVNRAASTRIIDLLVSAGALARALGMAHGDRRATGRPAPHTRRSARPARAAGRGRLVRRPGSLGPSNHTGVASRHGRMGGRRCHRFRRDRGGLCLEAPRRRGRAHGAGVRRVPRRVVAASRRCPHRHPQRPSPRGTRSGRSPRRARRPS